MLVLVPERSTWEMLKIIWRGNGKMEDDTCNVLPYVVKKTHTRIIILKLIGWKDFYKGQMAIASWEFRYESTTEGFRCRRLARLLQFYFYQVKRMRNK